MNSHGEGRWWYTRLISLLPLVLTCGNCEADSILQVRRPNLGELKKHQLDSSSAGLSRRGCQEQQGGARTLLRCKWSLGSGLGPKDHVQTMFQPSNHDTSCLLQFLENQNELHPESFLKSQF